MSGRARRPSIDDMTTSIDPALVERLSGEFITLGTQMGALGRDLGLLRAQIIASTPGAGRAAEPEAVGSPPTAAEARAGDRAVSATAEADPRAEADALGDRAGTASAQAPVGP